MMFWLVLLLLCGLAAAFAAAPLLFAARIDDAESRRDLNLALYRENVSDLVTDDADAAELEQEAQRALLQDTDGTDASVGTAAAGNSRKLLLATCLLVPVLGIIENMSYFLCPQCGERSEIFGHGGARHEAEKLGVPFLGEVPLHLDIRMAGDGGTPIVAADPTGPHAEAFAGIAGKVAAAISGSSQRKAAPSIVFE